MAVDGVSRVRLQSLQHWLMHPDRAYSPHEIATYVHGKIEGVLSEVSDSDLQVVVLEAVRQGMIRNRFREDQVANDQLAEHWNRGIDRAIEVVDEVSAFLDSA